MKELSRREFLRASTVAAVGLAAASCAQPTPQVIEKPVTVVVEKEVSVEKEVVRTVLVEKEVSVEKVVKETVVVQKEVPVEKVVTATPVMMKYKEAPMLAGLVQAGKLPPVDERLPEEPMVITPVEEVGQYGGTWHRLAIGPTDIRTPDRLMYDNLIRYTFDGTQIVPNVAKSWTVSTDGKQFTFSLRKGMKWSDGEPFTAQDIVFLVEDHWGNKEITPTFPSGWMAGGKPMVAEAPDDYTITFKFEAPFGLFMAYMPASNGMDFTIRPKHYAAKFHVKYTDKATVEKAAKDAGFEFWYQLYGARVGLSTAAFNNPEKPVIHAWRVTVPPPKQPVVLERNPYYYKVDPEGNQLPYIDRVEHMIVADRTSLNARAVSGEVDMQLRHIAFENIPVYEESKEKGDYRIFLWPQGLAADSVIFPNLNHKDPVMSQIINDKRFRYALSLGINRQEIIDAAYLGTTTPTQIAPPPTSPYYWKEQAMDLIELDPDRANKLLDEMGLDKRDADGYRLRPDGKRLSIVFEYAPVFGPWGDVIELLAAHWKKLSIEVLPKEEARQLFEERFLAAEHDFAMMDANMGNNPLIDPVEMAPYRRNGSKHAPLYAKWWDTGGKEGVEPPPGSDIRKALDLYWQIKETVDDAEQKKLFRQILELNKENLWVIGICTPAPNVVIVKNNFRNVPEKAISEWNLLTPGATAPEQYFIRQS